MSRAERVKRAHALGMLIVPAAGTAIALARAWERGVSALELSLLALMYSVAMIGGSVGYHRYFAHAAFKTSPTVAALLAIGGSMAGQGSIIYWVSNHRMHHQHVDAPGDPHSPHFAGERRLGKLAGFVHGNGAWTWRHPLPDPTRYAKDLLRSAQARSLSQHYFSFLLLGLVLPSALGALVAGLDGALGGLLWGGLVRLFLGYQVLLAHGYLAHTIGARPYVIPGRAGNYAWLSIPTFGESWHQNHHAFPTLAAFDLRPWQLDLGAWFIRALAALGLVWDVKTNAHTEGQP